MNQVTADGEEHFPFFCGTKLNVVLSLIDFIHQAVKKTVWPENRVRSTFARRTAAQVLADGDTLAFGPCPDRTLVALNVLRLHDINPSVVYHERRVPGFGPSTAHLALEMDLDGEPFFMDFGSRESRLMQGGYYYSPQIEETLVLKRITREFIGVDLARLTPYQLLGAVTSERLDLEQKYRYYAERGARTTEVTIPDTLVFERKYSIYNKL